MVLRHRDPLQKIVKLSQNKPTFQFSISFFYKVFAANLLYIIIRKMAEPHLENMVFKVLNGTVLRDFVTN